MAESGHGLDSLRSFPLHPTFASQPPPSFTAQSHPSSPPIRSGLSHEETARDGCIPNRNVIPGLVFSFPNNTSDWQNRGAAQTQSFGNVQPCAGLPSTAPPLAAPSSAVPGEPLQQGREDSTPDEGIEDGEVCEDEMGESYDPMPIDQTVEPLYEVQARERSRSYSPCLSPREINKRPDADNLTRTPGNRSGPKGASLHSPRKAPQADKRRSQTQQGSTIRAVAEARKQAQDAILRLWPLNVRYQHYLAEGIDGSLLQSLFRELGFDAGLQLSQGGVPNAAVPVVKSKDVSNRKGKDAKKSNDKIEATPRKTRAQDKSEERKDKIARLLAAKNTKAAPSAPQPSKPEPAQTPAQAPAQAPEALPTPSAPQGPRPSTQPVTASAKPALQSKSQSEKSKLLYQKMEALKKAREARGQKRPHEDEQKPAAPGPVSDPTVTTADDSVMSIIQESTEASAESNETVTEGITQAVAEVASVSNGVVEDTSAVANDHSTPSIPGLFLSSTPQPSPVEKSASGRHSAPSVVLDADERPFKRPFGQARESRPFLIDVSDDEDDAEMDIDSPDHLPSSILRPISPIARPLSTKSAPSIGEGGLIRQIASPIHTPSGAASSGSDNSARDDLENMNKKIEAMKLRIAEAEARKKAKQSLSESPASTSVNSGSQDDDNGRPGSVADPIVIPQPDSPIALLSRSPSQPASETLPTASLPTSLTRSPHTDTKRRSVSRAASERLPLLEARRREQQLRLQLLQSQMAGIQKEIQESLQEEERLKLDVSTTEEHEEVDVKAVEAEAGLPATLAMTSLSDGSDSRSVSSASSDDVEQTEVEAPGHDAQEETVKPIDDVMAASAGKDLENAASPNAMSETEPSIMEPIPTEPSQNTMELQSDTVEDVEMQEEEDSEDETSEDGSDDYEPPEADLSPPLPVEPQHTSPLSPARAAQHADRLMESEQADVKAGPPDHLQATSHDHDIAVPESSREVDVSASRNATCTDLTPTQVEALNNSGIVADEKPETDFAPYETPLQHFHAYRFHREYGRAVAGGLRSLTYSNKVDVKKELCPDELAGRSCPRGKQCEFQHFDTMQAPDDQILLQLGACSSQDEKLKQEYNVGLRQLLIEFRSNKVKDFQVISQGILDYRARFLGDDSKVLPLGNVAI